MNEKERKKIIGEVEVSGNIWDEIETINNCITEAFEKDRIAEIEYYSLLLQINTVRSLVNIDTDIKNKDQIIAREEIIKKRRKLGLTQEEMGEVVGFTKQRISQMEKEGSKSNILLASPPDLRYKISKEDEFVRA